VDRRGRESRADFEPEDPQDHAADRGRRLARGAGRRAGAPRRRGRHARARLAPLRAHARPAAGADARPLDRRASSRQQRATVRMLGVDKEDCPVKPFLALSIAALILVAPGLAGLSTGANPNALITQATMMVRAKAGFSKAVLLEADGTPK